MSPQADTKPLIFVTGASGFLGFHIVTQLLDAGYAVRGASRGPKVSRLAAAFAKHDKFEAVEVLDVSSSDLTKALNGVGAIIHTAAPLPRRQDKETAFRSAIEGSLHILREAEKAGIKHIVITGSTVTFPFEGPFGVSDWNPITKEEAFSGNDLMAYVAQKTFSERAIFEFVDTHPQTDITVLCPQWILGPLAPGFEHITPEPDYQALSTTGFIYGFLNPKNVNFPGSPGYIDVRDLARAHIAVLNSTPTSAVGHKRLPISSPYNANYKDAIRYIAEERPNLKDRLSSPSSAPEWPLLDLDLKRVEDVVSVKVDSYKPWKETILDAVDSLLALENTWKSKGFKVVVPTQSPV